MQRQYTAEVDILRNRGQPAPITRVAPRVQTMRIPMGGFVRHRGEPHPSRIVNMINAISQPAIAGEMDGLVSNRGRHHPSANVQHG